MEFDKKLKIPTCTKCRNHDIFNVPLKGHGKYCAFRDCNCWKCKLIEERHETNKRKRELNEAEVEAITTVSTDNAGKQKSLSSEELKNVSDKPSDSTTDFDESKDLKASGETDKQPLSKKPLDNLDGKRKVARKKRTYTRPTKQIGAKQTSIAPGFQPTLQHIQTHPYVATPLAACVRPTPHNMSYTYPFNAARTTPISGTFTTMAHDSLLCSHYQGQPYTYQQTVARISPNQTAAPTPLLMRSEVVPVEHSYEALDNLYWYLSPPNVCVSTRPSTLPRSLPAVRPRYRENCTPK